MIHGSVAYPVTQQATQLFAAPGSVLTLYNTGPSVVYVSTKSSGAKPGVGIPLNVFASVQWDADNPCYAATDPGAGQQATLLATDNAGQINDPSVVAGLISGGGVTATQIANAIAASGLTSGGIAAAILASGLTAAAIAAANAATPPSGTPVVLQALGIGSAIAAASFGFSVWVAGAAQAAGWTVPNGKRLTISSLTVEALNTNAAAAAFARLAIIEGSTPATVYAATTVRLAAAAARGVTQTVNPGAVVVTTGLEPKVRDLTGAAGVTYDVTLLGQLF